MRLWGSPTTAARFVESTIAFEFGIIVEVVPNIASVSHLEEAASKTVKGLSSV